MIHHTGEALSPLLPDLIESRLGTGNVNMTVHLGTFALINGPPRRFNPQGFCFNQRGKTGLCPPRYAPFPALRGTGFSSIGASALGLGGAEAGDVRYRRAGAGPVAGVGVAGDRRPRPTVLCGPRGRDLPADAPPGVG